jgi:cell wall assembly regulator SMI1
MLLCDYISYCVPEYLTDLDPIQPVWRHPAWLNLTSNGAGDNWCIDLAPLPEGHVGQIISFSHEIGPDCVIATSFQALLATFADELEAGIYVVVGWSLTKEKNTW